MVFYKDRDIKASIAEDVTKEVAETTQKLLAAKIEMRIIEPVATFNANPIHIEMQFRDFGDWSEKQLEDYHAEIMKSIGKVLKKNKITTQYSFYILPSLPPRSIWAQEKSV
ncbi:MAG: hypothetical protein AAB553_05005 [Patescibacteria group bacterium]